MGITGLCAVLASGRHYQYEQSRRFVQPQAEPYPEPHSEPHYPYPEPHSEPHYPYPEPHSEPHYPHPETNSVRHYPHPEPHSEPEPHSDPHYPFPEPHSEPEPQPEPEAYPEPHAEPYPEPYPEPYAEPEPFQIVYHYPQAIPSYSPLPYPEPYPEPEPYLQPVHQQLLPVQLMHPVHQQMHPVHQQMHPVHQQMQPVHQQMQPVQHQPVYTSAPVYRQLVRLVSSHTPGRQTYPFQVGNPTYPTDRTGRFIIPLPNPLQPLQFLNDIHSNTQRNGRLFFPFPYMNPTQPLQIDLNNDQANTIVNYVQSFVDPFLGTDGGDIGIDGDGEEHEEGSEEAH